MNALLDEVLEAHGGLDRWRQFESMRATIVSGGDLFSIKGIPQDPIARTMTVRLHEEIASIAPFGAPDQKTDFTPNRVAIVKTDGHLVAEREQPRRAFDGHVLETPWDPLDRAYFNGYALWTYLTTPFLLAIPGFEIEEIEPWREDGETWRGLRATFPASIASHSTQQDFYFGSDRLLRRHDYHVDIAGGFAAAQYVYDIVEADGFRLPTRRRAFRRDSNLRAIASQIGTAAESAARHRR